MRFHGISFVSKTGKTIEAGRICQSQSVGKAASRKTFYCYRQTQRVANQQAWGQCQQKGRKRDQEKQSQTAN